jgi:hypothetical protein
MLCHYLILGLQSAGVVLNLMLVSHPLSVRPESRHVIWTSKNFLAINMLQKYRILNLSLVLRLRCYTQDERDWGYQNLMMSEHQEHLYKQNDKIVLLTYHHIPLSRNNAFLILTLFSSFLASLNKFILCIRIR